MTDFAFLDSGTGGIPYMLELKKKCPGARCVYMGDTAHFPYGEKSSAQITECAASAIETIIKNWNPRALIIACNTISVTALSSLRAMFPGLPIVGTVPAIKLAASVTRNRRIGLLATNATVRHPYNERLAREFAGDCTVFSRGDPELISFIEHELFFAGEAERLKAVKPAVDFFVKNGCDTIILGCTHFTHVASDIQKAAGPELRVVDSRDGVANQALRVLASREDGAAPLAEEKNLGEDCTFYVTLLRSAADESEYAKLCGRFRIPWGGCIKRIAP